MNPRTALIERLRRHPELTYAETATGVRIEAPTPEGFAIEVCDKDEEWTVALGDTGFHETFDTAEEALNFVAWCYSGMARVREVWRGSSPERSILEEFSGGEWRFVSETRLAFVPFWRRRREVILVNPNLLKS